MGRLLRARGLRLRSRDADAVDRARRRRAQGGDRDDRARLGRERGLADRRRRRDLRRLPELVRDPLLGLLHRFLPDPARADLPRCCDRVPRQAQRAALAIGLGGGDRAWECGAGLSLGDRLRQRHPRRPDQLEQRGLEPAAAHLERRVLGRAARPLRRLRDPGRLRLARRVRLPRRRLSHLAHRGRGAQAGKGGCRSPRRTGDCARACDLRLERYRCRRCRRKVDRGGAAGRARRFAASALARARLPRSRRRRLRRDRARHLLDRGLVLRRPLPERARLEHEPGQQPDHLLDQLVPLHARSDDDRGAHLHADRARLPGLDLLGLPGAAARRLASGRRRIRRSGRPADFVVGPLDRRLLREAPGSGRFLAGACALAALSALFVIAWAELIGRIVACVFLEDGDLASISRLLAALAVVTAARAAIGWALETSGHATSWRVRGRLRRRALERVFRARPTGLGDLRTGEVATGVTSGLDALDPYFSRFLPQLVLAGVVSPAIIVWVAFRDPVSAVIMAITLPLIPLFGALIGKAAAERTKRRLQALSLMSAHFLDVVRGLATLRAYRRGPAQKEAIARTSEEFRIQTMGTLRVAFLSALALELVATMSIALIAAVIGIRLVNGSIELAPSFAVLVLAPELYLPLRAVAAQFHASADGLAAVRRIFELIDLEPAVPAPATASAPPDPSSVSLRCELRAGERTLLVGGSGTGKTTALSLLMRFADPDRGRICAGTTDLRELDPDEWRRLIAWLPQQPRLLAGTIAEALRIGAPEAGEEKLWEALQAAGCMELVAALPDALETRVGEGGLQLSAGELRRIALARALVREAPLLVLDEPTAHLDAGTAAQIRLALERLERKCTVVIASHDASLLSLADRTIELEGAPQ